MSNKSQRLKELLPISYHRLLYFFLFERTYNLHESFINDITVLQPLGANAFIFHVLQRFYRFLFRFITKPGNISYECREIYVNGLFIYIGFLAYIFIKSNKRSPHMGYYYFEER